MNTHPHEYEVVREFEVDATPEQAWQAVNTPQGLASWLFPVDEPEVRTDGRDPYAWGGLEVLAWDAPRHSEHFVEFDDGGASRIEFRLTELGDGRCLVRYVQGGRFVDDEAARYVVTDRHADIYAHTLRTYLQHVAPRTATGYVGVRGPDVSRAIGSFDHVLDAFGLDPSSLVGDDVSLEVPGIDPVRGVVDYLDDAFLGVRTEHELLRVYGRESFAGGMGTSLGHHLFREGADSGSAYDAWRAWLGRVFGIGV